MGLRERFENAGVDSFHCLIRMETPDGAADTVFGCVRPDARAACSADSQMKRSPERNTDGTPMAAAQSAFMLNSEASTPSQLHPRIERVLDGVGKRASVAALRGMIADIERCVIACIKTAHHRSRFILPAAMQQNAPGKTCWIDIAGIFMTVFDQYRISQLLGRAAGRGDLPGQLAGQAAS